MLEARDFIATPSRRLCLYCPSAATSLEHVIPAALGGRLKRRMLCSPHNGIVDRTCDRPLITQLGYLVHALRVEKDGRGRGRSVNMTTDEGEAYRVDADHVPHVKTGVVERDSSGRPKKAVVESLQQARTLLESMGLTPEHPNVALESKTELSPQLTTSVSIGGEDGFRGVLKIAYEFARGVQRASVIDEPSDAIARSAILDGGVASDLVRWLPFEMFHPFMTEYFSHHVLAWNVERGVCCVVELLNVYPFAVRLPGLLLPRPSVLYVQGIHGEAPSMVTDVPCPQWEWTDVPLHAQPLMLGEIENRLRPIMMAMQVNDAFSLALQCIQEATAQSTSGDTFDEVTARALRSLQRIAPRVAVDANLQTFSRLMVTAWLRARQRTSDPNGL